MKVLVVDDHAVVRQGLAAVLRGVNPAALVLEAADGATALALAAANPDIGLVLMDLMIPDATGLSAVAAFVAAHPAMPMMVVSSSEARADVLAALELGALGYVAKSATASTVAAASRLVLAGEVYVPAFMALGEDAAPPSPAPGGAAAEALTDRQQAVLALVREGVSNKEIAYRLGVTEGTVKARPVMVEVERMLSTTPLCLPSIQRLPAASVQYIAPCNVGARIASAARNDICSVCAMKVAAALLTRTVIGPFLPRIAPMARCRAAMSRRSACSK